jgi:hypothetical protein
MLVAKSLEKKFIFGESRSNLIQANRYFLPSGRPKQQRFSSKIVFSNAFCSDMLSERACETDNKS